MENLVTVFGGSGFVGTQAVRFLAKAGWRVMPGTRPESASEHEGGGERRQEAGYDTTSSKVMSASTLPGRSRPAARSAGMSAVFCGMSLSGGR